MPGVKTVIKLKPSLTKAEAEKLCRRYHSSTDAAQAAGITRSSFARICRRLGVEMPWRRNEARAPGHLPPIPRNSDLGFFCTRYRKMGVAFFIESRPAEEGWVFVVVLDEQFNRRIAGHSVVSFDQRGKFIGQACFSEKG